MPLATWFRTVWREQLKSSLLEELPARWEMFDRAGVERLLKEHQEGVRDHSYLLFSLLMLSFPVKSM